MTTFLWQSKHNYDNDDDYIEKLAWCRDEDPRYIYMYNTHWLQVVKTWTWDDDIDDDVVRLMMNMIDDAEDDCNLCGNDITMMTIQYIYMYIVYS